MKTKDKENIFKEAKEKRNIAYRRRKIRITPEYSSKTMQSKSQWINIFKVLKEKKTSSTQDSVLRDVFQNESELMIKLREKAQRIYCQCASTLRNKEEVL